jgi:hypothetical protein
MKVPQTGFGIDLHFPDLYGLPSVDFIAVENLFFPRPVWGAVEDYKAAFIGATAIRVADCLLKPFVDQRL